jgi:hypothetical protein
MMYVALCTDKPLSVCTDRPLSNLVKPSLLLFLIALLDLLCNLVDNITDLGALGEEI